MSYGLVGSPQFHQGATELSVRMRIARTQFEGVVERRYGLVNIPPGRSQFSTLKVCLATSRFQFDDALDYGLGTIKKRLALRHRQPPIQHVVNAGSRETQPRGSGIRVP